LRQFLCFLVCDEYQSCRIVISILWCALIASNPLALLRVLRTVESTTKIFSEERRLYTTLKSVLVGRYSLQTLATPPFCSFGRASGRKKLFQRSIVVWQAVERVIRDEAKVSLNGSFGHGF
jgi:hypothetical protein